MICTTIRTANRSAKFTPLLEKKLCPLGGKKYIEKAGIARIVV
jgi:hypothetical protein